MRDSPRNLWQVKDVSINFDDITCLVNYTKENTKVKGSANYISDYSNPGSLIPVEKAAFIGGEKVSSPMGGNIAAYADKDSALSYAERFEGEELRWGVY